MSDLQKADIILARLGGGQNPHVLIRLDCRFQKKPDGFGMGELKQMRIANVFEFPATSDRELMQKIISINAQVTDANENTRLKTYKTQIFLDISEKPAIRNVPDLIDGLYTVRVGGEHTGHRDPRSLTTDISRFYLMNLIKPYLDLSIEAGQTGMITLLDNSDTAKEALASLKNMVIKPVTQSMDDFTLQAENQKESLALALCMALFAAIGNATTSAWGTDGSYGYNHKGPIDYPSDGLNTPQPKFVI